MHRAERKNSVLARTPAVSKEASRPKGPFGRFSMYTGGPKPNLPVRAKSLQQLVVSRGKSTSCVHAVPRKRKRVAHGMHSLSYVSGPNQWRAGGKLSSILCCISNKVGRGTWVQLLLLYMC